MTRSSIKDLIKGFIQLALGIGFMASPLFLGINPDRSSDFEMMMFLIFIGGVVGFFGLYKIIKAIKYEFYYGDLFSNGSSYGGGGYSSDLDDRNEGKEPSQRDKEQFIYWNLHLKDKK